MAGSVGSSFILMHGHIIRTVRYVYQDMSDRFLYSSLLGNMIMFLFRKVIFSMLVKGIVLSKVTWLTYVKGTLVVLAVYIIALMATRDIVSDFNLVRASIRNIAKEPMPQRRTKLFITAGIIICMIAIFEYRQLRNILR